MSDVPDSVIEKASIAGADAAERARGGVVERGRARDRAFSEVIADWARADERQEWTARVEKLAAEYDSVADRFALDPVAQGRAEFVAMELRSLAAGTREDEQDAA